MPESTLHPVSIEEANIPGRSRPFASRTAGREIRALGDLLGMSHFAVDTHNTAEGAGAASLAAALQERTQLIGQNVGLTLCGGNVDADMFAAVLQGAASARV